MTSASLEVWYWPTPNGRKVTILLEELGLAYDVHPINIRNGDQLTPEFLAINPNNRIPALRDHAPADGGAPLTLWESGAILQYLADKCGQFLPDGRAGWISVQWLMFQMGGIGPMHGQANHFCAYVEVPNPYGAERYLNEALRLYRVTDERLGQSPWLAGEQLTIADFAVYPWAAQMDRPGIEMSDFPHLERWFDTLSARPGVQRGMAVLSDLTSPARMTDAERRIMFGDTQFQRGTRRQ